MQDAPRTRTTSTQSGDWAGDRVSYLLRWGLPSIAVAAGLFLGVSWRVPIWLLALAVMGISCLINARRCGRVHCRYTGPWYLLLMLPTLWLGVVWHNAPLAAWWTLAVMILLGSKVIWWITENRGGRYHGQPPQSPLD